MRLRTLTNPCGIIATGLHRNLWMTRMKPHFYNLLEDGIRWTKASLEAGGQLSHAALASLDFNKGVTRVVLAFPQHEKAAQDHINLSTGALADPKISFERQAEILLEKLRDIEKSEQPLAVVVEDDLARKGDLVLERQLPAQLLFFDDKPLHVKELGEIHTSEEMAAHLSQSSGYPLNAFIVPIATIKRRQELSENDLNDMASATKAVVNAAYDYETYSLWERG